MMNRLGFAFAVVAAWASVLGTPLPACAQEAKEPVVALAESLKGMARAEYEAGKILYADGDYAGAAIKFERAYEEAKDPRLLWNIAVAEKSRRRYARVYTLVERYLAEAGPSLSESDRADAQSLLETVRGFIGEVTLAIQPAGAEVLVDSQAVGVSPLPTPLRLEMGEREIRVRKPGYAEFVRKENVQGGASTRVEVQLAAEVHEGRLRIVAGRGDEIRVDGRVVGFGEWEGKLSSGIHSVQVSAPNKRTYQSDAGVSDNQLSTLRVTLEAPPAFVREQSGLGPWPWVIGGVALAGLGLGAYFLLRPDDEGPSPPLDGSLDPGSVPLSVRFR
jgi:hypothetical protein